MQATFYNLAKRTDSTKIPTSTGTVISVNLKEGTDLDNPIFQMQTNVLGYNYLLFDGHYYFITGRRYVYNNLFEISCTIDALASYRSKIKSSTQYVLRSTVSPNYNLIDNSYATEAEPDVRFSTTTMGLSDTGSYVLMTKSGNGVQYWGITEADLLSLLSSLFAEKQEDLWSTISDLTSTLGPALLDVTDYIIGCRWMPFSIPSGGNSSRIYLGYWDTHIDAKEYTTRFNFAGGAVFSLPVYPETDPEKAFMNCSQYHSLSIFVPGCGETPIDYAKVQGTGVNIYPSVDVLGNVTGVIENSDNEVIGRFYGTLGADVPISASNIGLGGFMSIGSGAGAIVGGISAIASGGASAVAEGAGDIASGALEVGSGILASIPDINTKGGVGSYLLARRCDLLCAMESRYKLVDLAPTQQGYPCMKTMTLGTNGFYMIKNPQVDFGDDLYIKTQIEGYMARGFYVE